MLKALVCFGNWVTTSGLMPSMEMTELGSQDELSEARRWWK